MCPNSPLEKKEARIEFLKTLLLEVTYKPELLHWDRWQPVYNYLISSLNPDESVIMGMNLLFENHSEFMRADANHDSYLVLNYPECNTYGELFVAGIKKLHPHLRNSTELSNWENKNEIYVRLNKAAQEADTHPSSNSSSKGCYVATCVYGSYDCPEVWTLRRYRDYTLDKTWYGRLFIKTYYAISPTVVILFGNYDLFKKFFKKTLDKVVARLLISGYEDTPYSDKY